MAGCNDLGPELYMKDFGMKKLEIDKAGIMVGLNLAKPVDLSQMEVWNISFKATEDQWNEKKRIFKRMTTLHTYVVNEEGDHEELEITFELKSQRLPKIKDL